ncbi:hypothetical protein BU16DRAFT_468738 [Lophium mytilinum]|uniref:HIG1 domain-containing protein n=1 Tax=Lophium mytilinum TaxID=390894 RepID=A0A6A6QH07_9PEZI|nr:hypothetical protein BU16DRAFT_468738 [Lophium mytilinum]
MKVITKEEEAEHYRATVKGGVFGMALGAAVGGVGVFAASKRFHGFRQLTIPFRAFLVASSGTFTGIISADRASRSWDIAHNADKRRWEEEVAEHHRMLEANKTRGERLTDWATENRYSIIFGSWVASMGTSWAIVSRNKYLTGAQKLVQARVIAQGLTVAVLLISFAFESSDKSKGKGRWETVKVLDPNDPTHKHLIEKRIHHERYEGEDQWKEMVEAEEERIRERKEAIKEKEDADAKAKGSKQPRKEKATA